MCGRYALKQEAVSERMQQLIDLCNREAELKQQIHIDETGEILPGNNAPALIFTGQSVQPVSMRWGFSGKKSGLVINARSESVSDRPLFRMLVESNRCVLPAVGYFEWRKGDGQKYMISPANGECMYLAGLYRNDPEGRSFVVLTQHASGAQANIHSRMPVMLFTRAEARLWLKGKLSIAEICRRNCAVDIVPQGVEQMAFSFDESFFEDE